MMGEGVRRLGRGFIAIQKGTGSEDEDEDEHEGEGTG
jgi:hypothetical protein